MRITLEVADGVARIRQVCGERLNAIDPAWVADLERAVAGCCKESVRVVHISADGPSFTVGGDLDHFAANRDRLPDALHEMIEPFHRALARLGELPVPVVCEAQGAIAGGGLGLLWSSDIVILSRDAKLSTAFSRLGLSGDGGSSWALPRLVGLRRALQLTIGGRVLSATEAVDWGLADEAVPRDQLEERAQAHVARLRDGPTVAYGHIRRLIRAAGTTTWSAQLVDELEAIVECGRTDDAREGIVSFTEKREARFDGR